MVEHVFAARMGFHVARDDADDVAAGILRDEVHRLPSGARSHRLRQLEGGEKIV
jgi:hypothetical protein